jgi:hypothetical protein
MLMLLDYFGFLAENVHAEPRACQHHMTWLAINLTIYVIAEMFCVK